MSVQPYAVAARELLRTTLLDAVREQLRTRDWAAITMADVARAAGVSRQTRLQRVRLAPGARPGVRPAGGRALPRRRSRRPCAGTSTIRSRRCRRRSRRSWPRRASTRSCARCVAADGGHELLPLVTTQGQPLLEQATHALAGFLLEGWPEVGARPGAPAGRRGRATGDQPRGDAGRASSEVSGQAIGELLGPFVERALSPPDGPVRPAEEHERLAGARGRLQHVRDDDQVVARRVLGDDGAEQEADGVLELGDVVGAAGAGRAPRGGPPRARRGRGCRARTRAGR